MSIRQWIGIAAVCLVTGASAQEPPEPEEHGPTGAMRSLITAERTFSATSVLRGTRAAFLASLAEDGLLLRPLPTNGIEFYTGQTNDAGVLAWQPVFAEVSREGDLGYTLGPWQFRTGEATNPPSAYGEYVSVWRKAAGQPWRLALDVGIGHPQSAEAPPDFPQWSGVTSTARGEKREAARRHLLSEEAHLSEVCWKKGVAAAFGTQAGKDVRILRPSRLPLVGKKWLTPTSSVGVEHWKNQSVQAEVSASGDLAFAFGILEFRPDPTRPAPLYTTASYLRIWNRGPDNSWKIALDVWRPIPAEPK